jgi:hypothetical protein
MTDASRKISSLKCSVPLTCVPLAERICFGLWALRGLSTLGWQLTTCWLSINRRFFVAQRVRLTLMDLTVAPASLSRQLNSVAPPPHLFHSIYQPNSSILCLAATGSYIFGGRQLGDILVLHIHYRTFGLVTKPSYTGLGP